MLNEIQKADDPERKWPKAELLSAIGFPVTTKNFLCNRYWENKDSISLNEIFELAVSKQEASRPGFIICKLSRLRNVGPKTFLKIIKTLNSTNMGRKCNAEWKRRHRKLISAKRLISGNDAPTSVARPK